MAEKTDITSGRRQVVRSPEKVYESFVTASVFKYRVEMKENDSFKLMDGNYVTFVDSDERTFILKWAPKQSITSGAEVDFRLSLPRGSIMNFTTRPHLPAHGEDFLLAMFSLPESIDVYYKREYFRVSPSDKEPLNVSFSIKDFGVVSNAKVTDIGLGGMGIEIPDAQSMLELGRVIEGFDIFFPDGRSFSFCVRVQYVHDCRCGLEFVLDDSDDYSVLTSYLIKRQKESRVEKQGLHAPPVSASSDRVLSLTGVDAVSTGFAGVQDTRFNNRTASAPGSKPRVLIIEQSDALQERLKKLLTNNGIEVIQSTDSSDGVSKAVTEMPDLVIIDIDMPMAAAYDCARSIKLHNASKNLPICMLSTNVQNPLVMKCAVLGVKEFILKYMDADYVLMRILGILGLR
ncbi:MAG: response regulator [Nitrospirae bacterium]|nr:response regulator [Nitrospirota bacterium]